MPAQSIFVRKSLLILCALSWAAFSFGQPGVSGQSSLSPEQARALLDRALANELRAAQDSAHPMRYLLRKTSPRITTTKEIVETREGAVALLVSIDGNALSPAAEQQEQARLTALFNDPSRQRHRKQGEDADTARALMVLRTLPTAFLYRYAGSAQHGGPAQGASPKVEKFTFLPNPAFDPPDLETQILTTMAGEIWIDPATERAVHLDGHLLRSVDFGWGILGRLNKGGWIAIDQADVGGGQWRTVRFRMVMSGRVLFKSRTFDTAEEESRFTPVPVGLDYKKAIELLRSKADTSAQAAR